MKQPNGKFWASTAIAILLVAAGGAWSVRAELSEVNAKLHAFKESTTQRFDGLETRLLYMERDRFRRDAR